MLVIYTNDGTKRTIKANTIITALPMKPNTEFIKSIQGKAKEVYAIGDAKEPHLIIDIMADGRRRKDCQRDLNISYPGIPKRSFLSFAEKVSQVE